MKTLLVVLVCVTLAGQASGQVPAFQNPLNNLSGTAANDVRSIVTDGDGNIYFGGSHTDSLRFGGSMLPPGQGGAFFGKVSAAGTIAWLYQGGCSTPTFDKTWDIAVDRNGDVYFCGSIAAFQTASFNGTPLPSSSFGGFVVKYTASGAFVWAHGYGGTVYAISIDSTNVPVINHNDQYVTKIDPATGAETGTTGTLSGSLMNPFFHNIAIDSQNNIIAQGGNKIVKFSPAMSQIWSTPVTASLFETFRITIDASDNVYGAFYALFGSVTIGGIAKTSFPNGFMYKLDGQTGAPIFVDSILIGSAVSKIKSIIVNSSGEYYIAGDGAFNVPHVVKLAPDKSTIWDKVLGSSAKINDLAMNADNCLVLGGTHSQTSVFDSYTLTMPNGTSSIDNSYVISLCGGAVDVQEPATADVVPVTASLLQNYPNPFNPTTTIRYALPSAGHVRVQMFNVLGQEVARLVDEVLPAGVHTASWTASSDNTTPVGSGVYFCRMQFGGMTDVRKVVLAR